VRPCPRCAHGRIEFNDRYRFDGSPRPAWLCDNPRCGFQDVVRSPMLSRRAMLRASKAVQAHAMRTALKAHARIVRAKNHITSIFRPSR
jgi:hypothetical protein